MTVTEKMYAEGSIKIETLEIEIPESCQYCGFKNMKIYGLRTRGKTMAEVRCMRCGKKLTQIEKDE